MMKTKRTAVGSDDKYYERTGEAKDSIAQWEDGIRTGGKKGTYEWWYFDSHFSDGSSLVIVFFTKDVMQPNKTLSPLARIDFTTADGKNYSETVEIGAGTFAASEKCCDVQIGSCYFKGDLQTYDICFSNDVIEAVVSLKGNVPAWRPETGYFFFGDEDEHYFAWLPAVPEGNVEATITISGETTQYSGTGYHDHNWGNTPMPKLINHWYWGRAKVGSYQIITSYITAEKEYGYDEFPIFMLAKDGQIIADDAQNSLTFTTSDAYIDVVTKKPVYNTLVFDYEDDTQHYRITYKRESDLMTEELVNMISGIKRLIAKIIGFDGACHRFGGTVTVERLENGLVVESVSDHAIWELMYFGHIMPIQTPCSR